MLNIVRETKAAAVRGQIVRYTGDMANSPRELVVLRTDDRDVYLIDPQDVEYGIHSAFHCMFDPSPGRRFILTDRTSDCDLDAHIAAVYEDKERKRIASDAKRAEQERLLQIGKDLAVTRIPPWAKSAIVAELVANESDSQTDYYGHSISRFVVLAWSKHNRDLFTEMRKAAARFPDTAHLTNADAEAEHREKYSMGGGFYLKTAWRHSDGWKVSKEKFWDGKPPSGIFMAIAKGECFA